MVYNEFSDMKRLPLIAVVLVLLLSSCDSSGGTSWVWPDEKDGNFWAVNTKNNRYYRVDAEMLVEGTYCEIWAEKGSGVDYVTALNIASKFDSKIYNTLIDIFGVSEEITIDDKKKTLNTMEIADSLGNNDGKLCILLLDIKDDYRKGVNDSYVAGYFRLIDFFENSPGSSFLYSNERDMIYIDINPGNPESEDFFSTIAHETQHLMNFVTSCLYRVDGNMIYTMDLWIDEGLSSAAEREYSGKHPENRWAWFNDDKSGLIQSGNNFFVWDNHGNNNYAILDDYSTVYLFFQWLRLQAAPKNIYSEIIKSPYPFYDYQAVTKAADKIMGGNGYDSWETLLKTWLAVNYINAPTGKFGYRGDDDLKDIKVKTMPAKTTSVSLAPGEGVYSSTKSGYSMPVQGNNIKYAGLDKNSPWLSDTQTFTNANGILLTFNANTNTNGKAETGKTTGVASTAIVPPGRVSAIPLSGPFPKGAGNLPGMNEYKEISGFGLSIPPLVTISRE